MNQPDHTLVLASASPRRHQLLTEAGIAHTVRPAPIDDGPLKQGSCTPAQWVAALAYLKAKAVSRLPGLPDEALILGSDTVCENDGKLLGQPTDADHAARMIRAMSSRTHAVLTAVALIDPTRDARTFFVDVSVVTVGDITDQQIADYLETNLWQGKAGAYNIAERLDAGWPISFAGTMDSIMGLPVARFRQAVTRFVGAPSPPSS